MNDELRAAFARLDRALQDAREALEPEPPTVVQRMIDACKESE